MGWASIFIICFIACKLPLGIPNVLNICHLSPYHLFSLPTFLLGITILFFINIKSLSLQTYLTDLPYQGHKLNLQTYPKTYPKTYPTNLPYNLPYKPTLQTYPTNLPYKPNLQTLAYKP